MSGYFDKSMEQWYPSESRIAGECTHCGAELYEGEEVIEYEGEVFCDRGCLVDYLLDTVDCTYITLEKGDGYE